MSEREISLRLGPFFLCYYSVPRHVPLEQPGNARDRRAFASVRRAAVVRIWKVLSNPTEWWLLEDRCKFLCRVRQTCVPFVYALRELVSKSDEFLDLLLTILLLEMESFYQRYCNLIRLALFCVCCCFGEDNLILFD